MDVSYKSYSVRIIYFIVRILVLRAIEIVPHGLMRVVEQHGKHNRVGGGHDQLGATGRQPQQNARGQHKKENGNERGHVDMPATVHLYI